MPSFEVSGNHPSLGSVQRPVDLLLVQALIYLKHPLHILAFPKATFISGQNLNLQQPEEHLIKITRTQESEHIRPAIDIRLIQVLAQNRLINTDLSE
jgi:hypothetical protein